jgi:alpha-glucosidase
VTTDALPTTSLGRALVHAPGTPDAAWWRDAVIYQVYPRSFADASGDGIGDLAGITARLDHLADLGVDAVWLSPFYRSPQADAGYDVADYRQVDPLFGTLDDFDAMLDRAHRLGLRVIVDLVPNHTSDEHVWFAEALAAGPGSAARERYLFRAGRGVDGAEPPNNWQSIFGGPAWTRLPDGEWYLHLFDSRQPDLNWEHPEVRAEFEDVLRFWLDRGVDGFRVDVAHGMVKAPGLPDWAGHVSMIEGVDDVSPTDPVDRADEVTGSGNQGPMFDQDGVHEIYRDWHRVLSEYGSDRMMVAEAWVEPAERLALYVRQDEMQQAFNFDFLMAGWDAERMAEAIDASLKAAAAVGAPCTWVLSNHDTVRHSTRFGLTDPTTFPKGIAAGDEQPDTALGLARARAATLVELALPGSAYLYQGEELGLPEHTTLPAQARQDPTFFRTQGAETGRDGCRVPLPWAADKPGYGFADSFQGEPASPWLPQPAEFGALAADQQDGEEGSTLELYRAALAFRSERRLGTGSLAWAEVHAPESGLLAFHNRDVLVLANMGFASAPVPEGYSVALSSGPEPAEWELMHEVPVDCAVYLTRN